MQQKGASAVRPVLYIVVPCYNEELVLPITSQLFLQQLTAMTQKGLIHPDSRILFVDDGSKVKTWDVILSLSQQDPHFLGIRQSRNRGHQNAVLAGLMEAMERCDITVSIDCDGQDDIIAMERMVVAYLDGCEIVYGVRSSRNTDTPAKRLSAELYYKMLRRLGVEVVFNHADYRLVSQKALRAFAEYGEVNLYLRGLFPLVGFKTTCVSYERKERIAGKSHYPLKRMLALALDGITSLSIQPIRMITGLGFLTATAGLLGLLWCSVSQSGNLTHWLICLMGGIQLISTGVIGEYVGRIHQEVKHRPRYVISERTEQMDRAEEWVKK